MSREEETNNAVIKYNPGFGNHFSTSAVPDALPMAQNNPLKCPHGLYAEQISGTAFTAPRCHNQRSWLYRSLPSVAGCSSAWHKVCGDYGVEQGGTCEERFDPNPMRWSPLKIPVEEKIDFVRGMKKFAFSGHPATKSGLVIYMYAFNKNMTDHCMCNSDGDFLIVPQQGGMNIKTEMGVLLVEPKEIAVIPRGIVFTVDLVDQAARGYVLEIYKGHFELPELGPIGSNGLANPRDFQYPTASFDTNSQPHKMFNKFCNSLYSRSSPHSPFNVVAWHGNYAPFKYNLENFCTINSVSFDHPDPSIYTVLTARSDESGTALADFVIFPPRWMVMEHTFRPPYFHRNCMTEFMGMIYGTYDAKGEGFQPGGASLHSCMTPHGPDAETYEKHVNQPDEKSNEPVKFDGGMAFMFETSLMLKLTGFALECEEREMSYEQCWDGFKNNFACKDTL